MRGRGGEGGKVIQNGLDDNELEGSTAVFTRWVLCFWENVSLTPLNLG